jgi:hypothetical protein
MPGALVGPLRWELWLCHLLLLSHSFGTTILLHPFILVFYVRFPRIEGLRVVWLPWICSRMFSVWSWKVKESKLLQKNVSLPLTIPLMVFWGKLPQEDV